ncbi:MAG: serpin family protein [Bacteroidales bacterium]|nr:serpin family protein [Bacteroidales bacterium]
MKFFNYIVPVFMLAFAFVACTSDENDIKVEDVDEVITELSLTDSESRAAKELFEFDINFFKAVVAKEQTNSNVVCSPTSAAILISLIANAADDELANDIYTALGSSNIADLNALSSKYLRALPNLDSDVKFASTNSVWYDSRYTINPAFSSVAKKYYLADCFKRDIQSKKVEVVNEINEWAANETNGVIDRIIDDLPADVASILANALYFKGPWAVPFETENTEEMAFYGKNGTSTVQMMFQTGKQFCISYKEFAIVRKQIANNHYEAIFILPSDDIDSFIAESDFDKLLNHTGTPPTECELHLPKFKYEPTSDLHLNDAFSSLGIKNLDKYAKTPMFVENVTANNELHQKVGIEFNESGAEGAAVSWGMWATGSGDHGEPKVEVIKFDHPFVFFIREVSTGAVLFAGKISDL